MDSNGTELIPIYREFVVSKPPSVNAMYRFANIKGRLVSYMTKEGKDWFAKELPEVKSDVYPPIEVPVMVGVTLFTTRMNQDLDNMFKASMDLLQKGGVIVNDNQIVRIVAEKRKAEKKDERLEIFVHVQQ